MDIDEISTFVAIAELGSFTHAAQRLHRTQPAISRRRRILEQELGTWNWMFPSCARRYRSSRCIGVTAT